MKRRPIFFRTLAASVTVFVVDFLGKELALWLMEPWGGEKPPTLFAFHLLKTTGFPLFGTVIPNGAVALLSLVIASVFLALAFGSHLFLPARLKAWPLGLGLLAGGFFANAVDRGLHDHVIDLFHLNFESLGLVRDAKLNASFNIAHIGEALGAVLLAYGLARAIFGDWTPERRGRWLVERSYQFRFCLYMQGAMTVGFAPMFLVSVFLLGASGGVPAGVRLSFFLIAPLAYVSLALLCWSVGLALSHRTAGAVVKFCRTAVVRLRRPIRKRDEEIFFLREADEFRARFIEVMKAADQLRALVERLQRPKPEVKKNF